MTMNSSGAILDCGGKRSATPLSDRTNSGVALHLPAQSKSVHWQSLIVSHERPAISRNRVVALSVNVWEAFDLLTRRLQGDPSETIRDSLKVIAQETCSSKYLRVPKWTKTIIAILLLPVCVGGATALLMVLSASGNADTTWVPILAGAGCWLAIYLLLPKPMLLYVFGHELTHALWTWLFGGRVKRFKASARGGHVIVTRNNFIIALAPYFFPLYAVLVLLLFLAGSWVWNWRNFLPVFHLLLGAAYAFHVTLTWHILKHNQTDISEQGYLFSAVVIFLGNASVMLLGVPLLVPRVGLFTALGWWFECTGKFLHELARLL